MGGFGSGNPFFGDAVQATRPDRKATVEECPRLDAGQLVRLRMIVAGGAASGKLDWPGWSLSAGVRSHTAPQGMPPFVLLEYAPPAPAPPEPVTLPVHLATTAPRFGGIRWWFVCPLIIDGRECGRRVGRLYLPPGCRYFGCRSCYGLTYRSRQDSRRPSAFAAMVAAQHGLGAREARKIMQGRL
jgi:hypothetical protein